MKGAIIIFFDDGGDGDLVDNMKGFQVAFTPLVTHIVVEGETDAIRWGDLERYLVSRKIDAG